ncbi:hypothetical protein A3D80_02495 [Candidatus Roizmanbacteria bacterium RIFCSPHIGHO2_02_FULL_40_13b]|uniref:Peptidase M50 domain-containing protein n=1 Tax=Candidatus Roizmanbacteria bacterium RIFCSPHIGHO2_01_FULL_39_24 TaxID=1802032 RepID=A0A1F7GIQ0_9BACT|nr:MAG: hypothetical protein A2799_01985 [Candidatus Roizmanbacteria bacterium RIFCSPHIGHO2_01_FULL_39_24]OGK26510.1 MAG: hypothetical protein A3D80_02495 [Candidatus Roizmanbacteria bacterium RIFCSPHIGHO2_02_FULL_40_13b]OGK50360.1 MAG: hypothetical protein A3A56_00260 [Candidatus Roizmanbacteria bacterium RIFCSPLOWO2_01_FULL_40_32]OGK56204.1 MAG: hypothetical protein A3H83_01655 [Candidatus Roizmanbacteria bacterium RIFCSPLOWO2_02_FULL_39_8]
MFNLILFIVVLSVLVIIHELGHFIAAKKNGVRVEEFGFGLPPRVFGKKIGETLYSLNWLPFGGFVKVLGEEEADTVTDKTHAFSYKKPWQKLVILTAGVFMNLVLAIVIFFGLLAVKNFVSDPLILLDTYHFRFGKELPVTLITGTTKGSPASKTNLKQGDIVRRVQVGDDLTWKNINNFDSLIAVISNTNGKPIRIETEDYYSGQTKITAVQPKFDKEMKRDIIGVSLAPAVSLDYSSNPLLSGFAHSYNIVAYNVDVLSSLFHTAAVEKNIAPVSQAVSGPFGIFDIVAQLVKHSGTKLMYNLLNFLATLSLSLALINILPFPALDGGRVAMVLYQWISGRKISPSIEKRLNFAGFAVLLTLLALISLNDIAKLFFK